MRNNQGEAIVARKCVERIRQLSEKTIFVDGVRSKSELIEFRKYWKFPLVVIKTDEKIIFKRIKERARLDDSSSLNNMKKRINREIEFGLRDVIKLADYVLINNGNIQELEKKAKELVKRLIIDNS